MRAERHETKWSFVIHLSVLVCAVSESSVCIRACVANMSEHMCVYFVPAGSPLALCVLSNALLWLPGAQRIFFCWNMLTNWCCWPGLLLLLWLALTVASSEYQVIAASSLFPTQTIWHHLPISEFQLDPAWRKSLNPAWNLDRSET